MRAIDVNDLKDLEELEYKYFRSPAAVPFYEADKVWEILESAPTITYEDLVPHGRWEEDTFCSNCRWFVEDADGHIVQSFHDFCPNCGAKMDGGKRQ